MSMSNHNVFDFNIDTLPCNRKEVFIDVLKLHYRTLLLLGFILFVFSVPLQISAYIADLTIASIYSEYNSGQITFEIAQETLISMSNLFSLIDSLLIIFFGFGLAGVIRVIKQLAWYEPVTTIHDFILGLKDNGRQYLILFLIIGTLLYASNLTSNLSSFLSSDVLFSYLGIIPKTVFLIIFAPVGLYALIIIAIYTNRFGSQIRLGLYVFFQTMIKSYKTIVILSIPFIVLLFPFFIVSVIARILIVFMLPFLLLKWFLFVSDELDRFWNVKHFPDLVDRGVLGKTIKKETKHEKNIL